MKKMKLIVAALITAGFISSCNFLDVSEYFEDTLPYDSVFSNRRNLEKYLWATASYFPDEGQILSDPYTPGPMATDEGFTALNTGNFRGMAFVMGEVTADDLRYLGNWDNMYRIIRKANTIFARMDEVADLNTIDKFELLGYTRFMRAYAYYHLLMDFGPLIIIGDKVLETNETPEYYDTYRSTYDESVDYVCNELEETSKYIPEKVILSQFGRPTKGAAYALIARLRLQQASPLYNGGDIAKSYFGSWKRYVDGAFYVSQNYEEKKWAVAAAAAKRVMDMGLYKLHTVQVSSSVDPKDQPLSAVKAVMTSIGGEWENIDPFRSYSEMFTGESTPQTNPEFIWARMSSAIRDHTQHSFVGTWGGYNAMCVTQKVVDAYRMVDGVPYQRDDAKERQKTSTLSSFSGYMVGSNISKMYVDREMRFYASIGFSGRHWTASSTSEGQYKERQMWYDINGNAGRYSSPSNTNENYPSTGYVITKYIHPNDAWKGEASTRINKAFPIIRYAEILLAYAEAANHLNQEYTISLGGKEYFVSRNLEAIGDAFNQVRYRAGLPGLSLDDVSDLKRFQECLEQERMVEFLFENQRYFDIRRWGVYEERDRVQIQGMDIAAAEPDYYSRVIVNHSRIRNRITDKRMIFLPLPRAEIRKVKSLDQNPGWGD